MAGFDTLDELLSLAGGGVSFLGYPSVLPDEGIDDADLLQMAGFYRGLFDLADNPVVIYEGLAYITAIALYPRLSAAPLYPRITAEVVDGG